MTDCLFPFLFDGADVRGAVVNLDFAWREVLARRDYPAPVRGLLGEAMAAAALLSSTLKFDGSMVLQTRASDAGAPVRLMVVECDARLGLRATATLGGAVPPDSRQGLAGLVGDGRLVITLDPSEGQSAYQGVVELEGGHLAHALENYMRRSEQLETRIHLAADGKRAAGLLVQRLPRTDGAQARSALWDDVSLIADTLAPAELLHLEPRELVRRLYHEFDLRVFAERAATFRCRCSRERVAGMLRMLGRAEVESIVTEQGRVSVDCEFCHETYAFDPIDVAQLFRAGPAAASRARH